MPVLGLQKGENFEMNVVPSFSWRIAPSRFILTRQRLKTIKHDLGRRPFTCPLSSVPQHGFDSNVVIAAYGTQATLHKHPHANNALKQHHADRRVKSARSRLNTVHGSTQEHQQTVRRLSLTLNLASDVTSDEGQNSGCYDRVTTTDDTKITSPPSRQMVPKEGPKMTLPGFPERNALQKCAAKLNTRKYLSITSDSMENPRNKIATSKSFLSNGGRRTTRRSEQIIKTPTQQSCLNREAESPWSSSNTLTCLTEKNTLITRYFKAAKASENGRKAFLSSHENPRRREISHENHSSSSESGTTNVKHKTLSRERLWRFDNQTARPSSGFYGDHHNVQKWIFSAKKSWESDVSDPIEV
ncbi:uncharacterized protein LOC143458777 [Clavelina lepadiformis]|uniref:uncharacterized protein LOC143458777 n=1 Tax=Clavelina lepadiformis TaxID=159417 RepID=UPI0040418B73